LELHELIRSRRSIGVVQEKELPETLIKELIEISTWAPSHKKTEPWKFRVFTGESRNKLGEELARLTKEQVVGLPVEEANQKIEKARKGPLRAPAIIILAASPSGKVPEIEEIVAAGCVLQNLLLAATDKGLATICRTGDTSHNPELKKYLQLEEKDKVIGLVYIGYPKKEYNIKAERIPAEEKTIWFS
jgi:nitroreductase